MNSETVNNDGAKRFTKIRSKFCLSQEKCRVSKDTTFNSISPNSGATFEAVFLQSLELCRDEFSFGLFISVTGESGGLMKAYAAIAT